MKLKGLDAVNRNRAALALVVLAVAGAGGYAYLNGMPGSSPTGEAVRDAMELSTGSDLEVLRVEDMGSLSRVTLKPVDGNQVTDVFVTSDGGYIVQNPVDVQNFTRQAEARSEFVSCLSGESARFYGFLAPNTANLTQHTQMVAAQAQLIGGNAGSQIALQELFAGPGNSQEVQQRVLNQRIVWRIGSEFTQGDPSNGPLMTVPELQEATGCEYALQ